MIYFVIVFFLLFVTLLMVCNILFNRIFKRGKKPFLRKESDVFDIRFNEEVEWLNQIEKDRFIIKSQDELRLSALYINNNAQKTAILVHGYGGTGNEMNSFARLFYEFQFNVLLPDLRGHGESEGDYIGFSYLDQFDLLKWIDFVINKTGNEVEIVLLGISMGGATVCSVSGQQLPRNVKFIVSDCAFNSVKDQLTYQLKRMYKLPSFPIIPITSLICRLKAGYVFGDSKIVESVQNSRVPMLFIHGECDRFVPTEMTYHLYEAKTGDKKIVIIHDAKHVESYVKAKEQYKEAIGQYINKYIS